MITGKEDIIGFGFDLRFIMVCCDLPTLMQRDSATLSQTCVVRLDVPDFLGGVMFFAVPASLEAILNDLALPPACENI